MSEFPRGLDAEYEMDRVEFARSSRTPRRMTRLILEGGPFDGRTWEVSLLPDRLLAEAGQYRPLLQSNAAILENEPATYIWSAADRLHEALR